MFELNVYKNNIYIHNVIPNTYNVQSMNFELINNREFALNVIHFAH